MDIYLQLTSIAAASHMAITDASEQVVFSIATTDVLKRDALLASMNPRVPSKHTHALRSSPLTGREMFSEQTLKEAKKDLDKKKSHDFHVAHCTKDFDPKNLVSSQMDRVKDTPPPRDLRLQEAKRGTAKTKRVDSDMFTDQDFNQDYESDWEDIQTS